MTLLTIIITAYNSEPYLNNLLDVLNSQITDEVEVLIVDDGSDTEFKTDYAWAQVIRQDNHGVSYARNVGIDRAKSPYLAFIDADDLVSGSYIENILNKIKTEEFDYCYMSWRSLDGNIEVRLMGIKDKFPSYNQSVWNRVYKKEFIGDLRFNTNKSIAEDAEFLRSLHEERGKKAYIAEFMYYYRTDNPNSLSSKFQNGRLRTRRVVYYFPRVTANMSFLINEFKELNEVAEIILMTNQNDISQLAEYALVCSPKRIHGTELRGYPTSLFTKVVMPIKADIVIWTEKTYAIGGLETFNYNFCKNLGKDYDIIVLYKVIDPTQMQRLSQYARVIKNDIDTHIECDTLIVNRITDEAPRNVHFKRKVQMVHSCKWDANLKTPKDNDYLVPVSQAVANSYPDFKEEYKVIHNMTSPCETNRALIIVSATRTGTNEKGQKRMIALSNLMKMRGIPFIWLCFCDNPIQGANLITFMKPTLDISPYIKSADYLAQLSDHEGFCYSIVESMELGTPVLVTDLAVLPELGFKDGKTGYILPWEINEKTDIEKIYVNQLKGKFTYKFDNVKRIEQWKEILGCGHPYKKETFHEETIKIRALLTFDDALTHERINKGDVIERNVSRAYDLMQKKFVELDLS